MYRPRIIPCLLLKNSGLIKTVKFKKPRYIGDPMNAIRIFNQKKADELIFLDIQATKEKRCIKIDLIKEIGEECMMPFAVGGGIKSINDIEKLFKAGAEKVVINSALYNNPNLIKKASDHFGSQSIIVSIDVKKNIFGNYFVYAKNGTKRINAKLDVIIKKIENYGAGEIFINSISRDGTYSGYDTNLIKTISNQVNIPVIACGGASGLNDLRAVCFDGGASAAAAGSLFVYHGPKRAVLINYPTKEQKIKIFEK